MKLCGKCKQLKPKIEFAKNSAKKDGLNWQCKKCNDEYQKQWYNKNKKKRIKQINIWRDNKRQEQIEKINNLKTHCYVCGNRDIRTLEFHHYKSKQENISSMIGKFSWKNILKEIEKCIIVCANCHKILHSLDRK
jgi:polyribonucleotide nucleotidyltransferase